MTHKNDINDTLASDLAWIANAPDRDELKIIQQNILEAHPLIQRMTAAVTAALFTSEFVSTPLVVNGFERFYGLILDGIAQSILSPELKDLSAIHEAAENWRKETMKTTAWLPTADEPPTLDKATYDTVQEAVLNGALAGLLDEIELNFIAKTRAYTAAREAAEKATAASFDAASDTAD